MKIISGLRQGDVYLAVVDELPKGATKVVLPKGRIVLAYGEVTGHAHAIYEDIEQVQIWNERGIDKYVLDKLNAWIVNTPKGTKVFIGIDQCSPNGDYTVKGFYDPKIGRGISYLSL